MRYRFHTRVGGEAAAYSPRITQRARDLLLVLIASALAAMFLPTLAVTPAQAASKVLLTGQFVDADGQPVSDVSFFYDNVDCSDQGDLDSPDDYSLELSADDDGSFAFSAFKGQCYYFEAWSYETRESYYLTDERTGDEGLQLYIDVDQSSSNPEPNIKLRAEHAGSVPLEISLPTDAKTGAKAVLWQSFGGRWGLVSEAEVAPGSVLNFEAYPGLDAVVEYKGDAKYYSQFDGGVSSELGYIEQAVEEDPGIQLKIPNTTGTITKSISLKEGVPVGGKVILGKASASETTVSLWMGESAAETASVMSGETVSRAKVMADDSEADESGYVVVDQVVPEVSGEYAFIARAPGSVSSYSASMDAKGYSVHWLGGAVGKDALAQGQAKTFTLKGTDPIRLTDIVLSNEGSIIKGKISALGTNQKVYATDLETGEVHNASVTGSEYQISGLQKGIYWVDAAGWDSEPRPDNDPVFPGAFSKDYFPAFPDADYGAGSLVLLSEGATQTQDLAGEDRKNADDIFSPWVSAAETVNGLKASAGINADSYIDFENLGEDYFNYGASYTYLWTDGKTILYEGELFMPTPGLKSPIWVVAVSQGDGLWTTAAVAKAKFSEVPAATPSPQPVVLKLLSAPYVSGNAQVGKTLTLNTGEWNIKPEFSYQWYAGDTAISGATASTYTVDPRFAGQTIKVKLTAKAGDAAEEVWVRAPAAVALADKAVSTAKITGTAKVGKKLTAAAGPSGWKNTYQWLLDGKAIKGATAKTLKVTAKMAGKKISYTLTSTRAGHETTTATSAKVKIPKIKPTIKGKLTRTSIYTGQQVKLTVQIKASGLSTPGGKATVKVAGKTIKISAAKLKKGKGKVTVALPKITKAGTYKVKVVYTGGTNTASRTVITNTLRVANRPVPSTTPSPTPSPSGN
ncbi:MAG: hypothetical protein LBR21_06505 [Propionibacteriaceae bacterium]|jgi:hypothetical protein|nr:hypothetical protein [Propionibacteriaceae bacterium]